MLFVTKPITVTNVRKWYNDVNTPQDATIFLLLISLIQPYMFRATNTAFGTMHRHCSRSAAVSLHCTKSCIYSQKVLLRMGEFVARNMLG